MDVKAIQEIMGYKNVEITMDIYAEVNFKAGISRGVWRQSGFLLT